MRAIYALLVIVVLAAWPQPAAAQSPEPADTMDKGAEAASVPGVAASQHVASESVPSQASASQATVPEAKASEDTEPFKDPFAEKKAAEEEDAQIADPLYPWNKAMFHVNDKLYYWALKPVAQGYSKVIPEDFRIAISNFFENLKAPVRFVNNLLQLKFKPAGEELARFVVNSTIGVGGLGDPAKTELGLKRHDEDLGQTFGRYGIGPGFYLVWPLLGPSTLRDTVGFVGDRFLSPTAYITPTADALAISGLDIVNRTSFRIGDYEDIVEAAVDPYVSIRDGYLQHRKKEMAE
jgi:phospholipid-binding lipoprotein MlaA